MKRKNGESEEHSGQEKPLPIPAPGIGTRIKAVADKIGSRGCAAEAAGVSSDMLYRYIREDSSPSFAAMVGLCAQANASLDWLATGEGPQERLERGSLEEEKASYNALDESLLQQICTLVRESEAELGIQLSGRAFGRVVSILYKSCKTNRRPVDPHTAHEMVELAADL